METIFDALYAHPCSVYYAAQYRMENSKVWSYCTGSRGNEQHAAQHIACSPTYACGQRVYYRLVRWDEAFVITN